jgi:hypothetical protein
MVLFYIKELLNATVNHEDFLRNRLHNVVNKEPGSKSNLLEKRTNGELFAG